MNQKYNLTVRNTLVTLQKHSLMDENQQEKSALNILKQEDISQIIKYFSFVIQQRFEEIQKNYNYFTCLNSINYDRSEVQKDILYKYAQYKTSDQHEIKLLQKFVQRLLQVFQFFRQKTDDPQILQQMSQKIHQKFNQILKNQTNCHFFVNNRPKTHSINVKPLQSRSSSNDFLSIVGPGGQKNDKQYDIFTQNYKKSRTQIPQKRVIEVGKLFKYVFSVLKRGYLIKLRMQKPEKKNKTFNKENYNKVVENTATISVQGTCAILRNCPQKSNKQNNENYGGKILSFCRDKLSINPLNVTSQNRKQFQITQKIKNRSISTNQYSFISSQNPSILKQSTGKTRQIDKKINIIYDILNIQKYSILKVLKQPEICKKDQLKRNVFIENECKKFILNYEKWSCKDKQKLTHQKDKKQFSQKKCSFKLQQSQQTINLFDCQKNQFKNHKKVRNLDQDSDYESDSGENEGTFFKQKDFNVNAGNRQKTLQKLVPLKINFKTQENQYFQSELTSAQNGRHTKNHTIVAYTSRPPSKQAINILTDKPQNLIEKSSNLIDKHSNFNDKTSNLIDHKPNKNLNEQPTFKSRPNSHQQKKALRLNLPIMLSDKSNYLNQTNLRIPQKSNKLSEKSQYYLQNYHIDCNDDGVFVPLLPKKENNNENNRQNRNNLSVKKNNLMANFHPLNRCRLFREKKIVRNSIMIPLMEYKNNNNTDLSLMNGRMKNAIF